MTTVARVRTLFGGLILGALVAVAPVDREAMPTARAVDDRIVAIGDVHGAYGEFVDLLETVGLIDERGRWSGGRTILVQTGDFVDRGASVRAVMDLLMALERQAEAAGGRVVVLLGNHEVMNLLRILDDVSPAAYASFVDDNSEARRLEAYARYVSLTRARRRSTPGAPDLVDRDAWMAAHPPGFVEYAEAMGPDGRYGRWLRGRQAVVRVGDTVFLHGGLNPAYSTSSLDVIDATVHQEIGQFDRAWHSLVARDAILPFLTFGDGIAAAYADLQVLIERLRTMPAFVGDPQGDRDYAETLVGLLQAGSWSVLNPDGPLWFRGFASWTDGEGDSRVDELLQLYATRRFVVGHTVLPAHRVEERFGGRVFLIDTGMLSSVYLGGRPSALEIVGNRVTATYLDRQVALVDPDRIGLR